MNKDFIKKFSWIWFEWVLYIILSIGLWNLAFLDIFAWGTNLYPVLYVGIFLVFCTMFFLQEVVRMSFTMIQILMILIKRYF
jgi:hypothetical protein